MAESNKSGNVSNRDKIIGMNEAGDENEKKKFDAKIAEEGIVIEHPSATDKATPFIDDEHAENEETTNESPDAASKAYPFTDDQRYELEQLRQEVNRGLQGIREEMQENQRVVLDAIQNLTLVRPPVNRNVPHGKPEDLQPGRNVPPTASRAKPPDGAGDFSEDSQTYRDGNRLLPGRKTELAEMAGRIPSARRSPSVERIHYVSDVAKVVLSRPTVDDEGENHDNEKPNKGYVTMSREEKAVVEVNLAGRIDDAGREGNESGERVDNGNGENGDRQNRDPVEDQSNGVPDNNGPGSADE